MLKDCPKHLKSIGDITIINLTRGDIDYWNVGMTKLLKSRPKPLTVVPIPVVPIVVPEEVLIYLII
jgi:hypothetical protein